MLNPLRYNVADARLSFSGRHEPISMTKDKVSTFNLRHQEVLSFYGLELIDGTVFMMGERALQPWCFQKQAASSSGDFGCGTSGSGSCD